MSNDQISKALFFCRPKLSSIKKDMWPKQYFFTQWPSAPPSKAGFCLHDRWMGNGIRFIAKFIVNFSVKNMSNIIKSINIDYPFRKGVLVVLCRKK